MIIITGGAGFIGSNIVAGLNRLGHHDLVVVDWLGKEDKWRNLAHHEIRSIVPPEQLFLFLERHREDIQAVIHMGAISSTTECDVDLIARTNIDLSWELWCYCRDNHKQFIYASSAATYGDGAQGFDDHEDTKHLLCLKPLNAYGWSKAFFDLRIAREKEARRTGPKQCVGLKFFNVYGPNEYHKGSQKSVIAHIYPQVDAGHPVELFKSYHPDYDDGGQLRDFVWVHDCVAVVCWLLAHPEINGLFNVGTGKARSFFDLAKATWSAMNKDPIIRYKEMPVELRAKYQYFTQANMSKLRQAGYVDPMTALEEGIALYVKQYLAQADPYC